MNNVLIAGVKEERPIGRSIWQMFTPAGYGVTDTVDPLSIPYENLDTIEIYEMRFEEWQVEGRDEEGNIRTARMMREELP